ncbi:MAG: hypothetical protein ACRDRL_17385 [Sciscionella sp.]
MAVLTAGDAVCCPRGKEGAHQIINRTEVPVRVLTTIDDNI